MIGVVLATGPSMSNDIADFVRDRANLTVAVSDSYKLAPWADCLVSSDQAWWLNNKDALEFAGEKFSAIPEIAKIEGIERAGYCGVNSGLLGLMVAVKKGCSTVLLCGVDMRNMKDHFFGTHKKELDRSTPDRTKILIRQFFNYRPSGVKIINCTQGSAVTCYPFGKLEDQFC